MSKYIQKSFEKFKAGENLVSFYRNLNKDTFLNTYNGEFQNTYNCQMCYFHGIDTLIHSANYDYTSISDSERLKEPFCKELVIDVLKIGKNKFERPLCLVDMSVNTYNLFKKHFPDAIYHESTFTSTNGSKRYIVIIKISNLK